MKKLINITAIVCLTASILLWHGTTSPVIMFDSFLIGVNFSLLAFNLLRD